MFFHYKSAGYQKGYRIEGSNPSLTAILNDPAFERGYLFLLNNLLVFIANCDLTNSHHAFVVVQKGGTYGCYEKPSKRP